ncbi:TPA: hypothetical protein N0F65_007162 [Lagenidium giganteum]|uniref:Transcription elongation factor SPT5 n=1 Tax=Lagenidium giganteum TaxID=4803 RepID=A0AAV2ZAU8_9STRA|nr:TPA: hypothetical protein N0F65_007162 [Lagenidium giganteum]
MSSSEEDRNLSEEEEDLSEEDVPEEEEEDDDEEEEEQAPAKKRKPERKPKPKKKRKRVNMFIEEEADVDEDEEEEEDDEEAGFYGSERVMAEEAESSYRYEPQSRMDFDEDYSAEEIVNRIKKRHSQSRKQMDDEEEGGEAMQSEVAQQSLLPSIQDPRMWVFKCKPGREQHLVVGLMNKFLEFARRGEPLQIKSVVASASKGFIYVEAEREPHTKDALNGLRDVMQYSMKLVPIHEMPSVLNIQKKRKPLAVGAWARIKRAGVFKGDLCKVLEILDNGARAVVKLIPRLDPVVLSGGEQPKYKKGQRPAAKLFNVNMVHGGDVVRRHYQSTGEMMDFFDNDYYKDGFLIKEMNINMMLQTEDVNPTLDEINKFTSSLGDEEGQENDELLNAVEADDWKNKVDLTKGDTVRVIEGDLVNLMGVVLSTNTGNGTVRVMPLHEEIKDTILDFQLKQLMKYVKVGDHIKVVSGRYSGETGTVVAVDDSDGAPVAIVLVDSMAREIQVRVRDLQESAEVSHGLDSLKGKELYDLVALAHGDVGVITHVGREGFNVLCQNGQSRQISDQEIQRKITSNRAAAALDKKHNHVSVGEMVNVVEGPFAGHSGTVKHIYRTFLFLHNNRIMTNAGIFVARARQVILSGSKARSDMIQNSTVPRMDQQRGRNMPPQRGNDRHNQQSELICNTVKIKKGQWKGYIGIVVDESDQKVKVEIHCKAKVVDVDRLHVAIAGTRDGVIKEKARYSSTPMTGATPLPSQTPLHNSAMTPMATPLHRGMGTPQSSGRASEAWNVANDDALLETQYNQEKDITHATSFGTPLEPAAPTNDHMSSRSFSNPVTPMAPRSPTRDNITPVTPAVNPSTPGMNPTTPGLQPRTPAYMMSHNPTTPGLNPTTPGLNLTTPAHHLSAATPGHTGMEPMTPGFNPTTPGLSAMTPGLNPVTPGLNTPGYHHNPTTPGMFGVGTPMMGRMNSATTPAATPGMMSGGMGVPMTPAFHHEPSDNGGAVGGGEVTWKMRGVEVEVISGEHTGSVGVISSVSGNSCTLDVDGRFINVTFDQVKPVVPEKQDTVMVLSGDEAGKTGSLIGTDGSEGIVKVDGGSEIKVYAIALLAKIAHFLSGRNVRPFPTECRASPSQRGGDHAPVCCLMSWQQTRKTQRHKLVAKASPTRLASLKRSNQHGSFSGVTQEPQAPTLDDDDIGERKIARQNAAIALAKQATAILASQKDPEELDFQPYRAQLNDLMLNELASQLHTNVRRLRQREQQSDTTTQGLFYSNVSFSRCDKVTTVGMRAFVHAVGHLIRRLDLSHSVLPVDVLKVMATGIEQLEWLDFSHCPLLVSESIHQFIYCCKATLTKLNMSNCAALNDDALGWIAGSLGPQGSLTQCVKLLSLDISYTKQISDRGLACLGTGCRALQFVNLEGLERISDTGILKLVQGCKALRVLSLKRCVQLTDATLVHLGQHGRNLRSLNICGCYAMSSTGLLAMVDGTPQLQMLNLEGCLNMRGDVLAPLATKCLSLHILNLTGCQEITDNGIATLVEHLPFVRKAQAYRGLEPRADCLPLKFSVQQRTIVNSAALRIQALYRGHVGRKIAAIWRTEMIDKPATQLIQRRYRAFMLRKEVNARVHRTTQRRTSAIKIQARTRGVLCRTTLEAERLEQVRLKIWSKHAVRVQAAYRSHWTRKQNPLVARTLARYRREQQGYRRRAAAVRLQRAFRARYNRSKLDDIMTINRLRRQERINAATLLQRLYRTRIQRKVYRQMVAALNAYKEQTRELESYVIKVQCMWRGHRGRRHLQQVKREAFEREQRRHAAASRINAGARGYFGRQKARSQRLWWQNRQRAARTIQRAWRNHKKPSAERLRYEAILRQLNTQLADETLEATKKQEDIIKRTRLLVNQDSASEPESDDDWRDFQDENGYQFWFSPSRNSRLYMRPNEMAFERSLLMLRCRVYWPMERRWFDGRITRFNRVKCKHRIEYDDGDHEWLHLASQADRIQLFNDYCWCMYSMQAPTARTLRAAVYLKLRFQQYDQRYMGWRTGVIEAYNENSDLFLVTYDDGGVLAQEWVDIIRNENLFQVQDATSYEWYSMSGYVFGHAFGRPMTITGNAKQFEGYYCMEDYLNYVEQDPAAAGAEDRPATAAQEVDMDDLLGEDEDEGEDGDDEDDEDDDEDDDDGEEDEGDEDGEEGEGDEEDENDEDGDDNEEEEGSNADEANED